MAFILILIACFLTFVLKSFLGTIVAIISLIISLVKIKEKNILNIIALIVSSLIIVFSIIAFIVSFNVVNTSLSKAKQNALNSYAIKVSNRAKEECLSSEISGVTDSDINMEGFQCEYDNISDIISSSTKQYNYILEEKVSVTVINKNAVITSGKIKDLKNTSLISVDLSK